MDGEEQAGRDAEIVETPPSPLADRLRAFRDGVGDQPDEDKPRAGEEADDEPEPEDDDGEQAADAEGEEGKEDGETQEDGQEAGKDDDAEGDEEADADEGEDAEPPAPKGKARTYDVEIPTLNADGSKGPRGAGVLLLEGLPQEFRDTIVSHVKRSQALDGVQQRLEQARELEVDARFFRNDPLNAMRLIGVEKPELAAKFVESWIHQNPKAVKALIKGLKLDETDEEKLQLRGDLARQKERDELAQAYSAIEQDSVTQEFKDRAHSVVDELTGSLALDGDDKAAFEQLAGARIVAEMERRAAARQSPYLNKTELLTCIQPIVKRFTGAPPAKGKATGKPGAGTGGLSREQMRDRAKGVERFRQVRGGGSGSGVRPSGTKKTKLPRDMGERIKALRAGKL